MGSLAVTACAAACAIPLLAGVGVISLGAGALGGTRAFYVTALIALAAVTGVWWWRRRRTASTSASLSVPDADQPSACQSDHSCAGGACGCS